MTAQPRATDVSRASPAPTCPICGGTMRRALAGVRDPQTGDTFDLIRCSRCELGATVPAPDDLDRYYGERYYGGRHGMTQRRCVQRRIGLLQRATRGATTGKLADIGCGDGSFLLEAKRSGWTVAGTEVNPPPTGPDIEIRPSIEELRPAAPFDCITLWHSLEHLRGPGAALADLAGMLRPGGTLLLAVPDARGWQARLFGLHWLHLDVPRHLHHFSLPSLRAALAQAGVDVVEVRHQEEEYDVFGWMQSALNAVMPTPNILFDALTGRPRRVSAALVGVNVALGAALFLPALAATALSSLARRGGTLVLTGRRRG